MGTLGNTPRKQTVLSLAARKSFALGVLLRRRNGSPVDLTGGTVRMVVAQPDHLGGAVVLDRDATLVDPLLGVAQLELQANDLALDGGEYPYAITFVSALGYSTLINSGVIDLRENPDADATNVYAGVNPSTNLAAYLEDGALLTVEVTSVDGLSTVVDAKIVAFTADATTLRDAAAAEADAANASAISAAASAVSAAASASVAQTVAQGATDPVFAGVIEDPASQTRGSLNTIIDDKIAAADLAASDAEVSALVDDIGSATRASLNVVVSDSVDAIDHDAEVNALLANPASATKATLDAAYGQADDIDFTPTGAIAANNVQAALAELDAEKSAVGHAHGYVLGVVAGAGVTVDNTDAQHPVVSTAAAAAKVCRAFPTAATNLANNVITVIPLDGESFDAGGLHDPATNPSRITATVAGYYQYHARVSHTAASGAVTTRVHKNGVVIGAANRPGDGNGGPMLSDVVYLAVGDYLELAASQASGGAAQTYGGEQNTYLTVARIGG